MEKGILFNGSMVCAIIDGRKTVTRRPMKIQPKIIHAVYGDGSIETERIFRRGDQRIHPPYAPGDLVYVRETWKSITVDLGLGVNEYYYYRATDKMGPSYNQWSPSIHMPKQAARIWMTVASVKPERAKDITEDDAPREGFESRAAFLDEWMKIYGEWTACFWAWRIEFKDIQIGRRHEC